MQKKLYDFIVLFEWSLSRAEMDSVVEDWKEDLDNLRTEEKAVLRGFYMLKLEKFKKKEDA